MAQAIQSIEDPSTRAAAVDRRATRADRFEIARALREIASLLEVEGGNPFKARAYERGAEALEAAAEDLDRLVAERRLTSLPGIGAALEATIEELVRTGESSLLAKLRAALPPGALELRQVLGLRRMRALHQALGIGSLADLEAALAAGKVREVKGFGAATEQKLLARVRGLAESEQRLLLHQATAVAEALLRYLRAHPAVEMADVAGDLRRRMEFVNRLDLVAASRSPAQVIAHMRRYPPVAAVEKWTKRRVEVRLAEGLPVGLVVSTPRTYAALLHRRTGSAAHLAKLDELVLAHDGVAAAPNGKPGSSPAASRRGGAYDSGEPADVSIYRRLGLPYIPPELREDWGEIEAALDGSLPAPLLTLDDLQGVVHCHTDYSDGRASIEQMARGAEALGLRYLTITDHSPSAGYAGGLSIDRLREQWDEIARVQEQVSVRLLRGVESDILVDGALDLPDRVLEQLDVVIASVHNRHGLDRARMTRRIATAMRHPCFKIWGHALARYVLSRPPIDCDVEAILDVIAESRAAIEVNGDPYRLDLEPRWIHAARRRGIRFTIGADAHSVAGMRNLRWGVDMARRGGLTPRDVLNTLDADSFRAAVAPAPPTRSTPSR